jgi:hypothetical protein
MHSESISSKSIYSKNNDDILPDMSPTSSEGITKEPLWYIWMKKTPIREVQIHHSKRPTRTFEAPSKRCGHSAVVVNKSMIIFGGRHLTRSLANLYFLDFDTLLWGKLEPLGQIPPARDSHSCVVVSVIYNISTKMTLLSSEDQAQGRS